MDKKTAIEKAIIVWQYIAEHDSPKKEVYAQLNLPKDTFDCPLCEYVFSNNKNCTSCVLYNDWSDNEYVSELCTEDANSVYMKWVSSETPEERAIYATAIVNKLKEIK